MIRQCIVYRMVNTFARAASLKVIATTALLFVPIFSSSLVSAEEILFSIKGLSTEDLNTVDADPSSLKIYQYNRSLKDEIKRSQGGVYSINIKSRDNKSASSEEIEIEIDGNLKGSRLNRVIRIIRSDNPFFSSICQNRTFHLAFSGSQPGGQVTKNTVNQALRQLDNTSNCSTQDMVVSFFRNAIDKIDPSVFWSQPECRDLSLQYNYARALYQGCLILNYKDDCDLAASEFEKIKHKLAEERELSRCLKVTSQSADDAIIGIQSHQKQIQYAEVPYAFKNGEYDFAAKAAESLLEDYDNNHDMYRRVNITRNRLLMDAGVSYLLLGEIYLKTIENPYNEESVSCGYFRKSFSHLSKVTKPDSQTTSNLEKLKNHNRKCSS